MSKAFIFTFTLFFLVNTAVATEGRLAVLQHYADASDQSPSAQRGKALWQTKGPGGRTCSSCHGNDLHQAGTHLRTRKPIDPMAPSVNPERFTNIRKVEKWFYRNCKWTWGRECTAREKADILRWLNTL